jgi:hypothetical protein
LRWPWKSEELRQKLVLTPEEKRVIVFLVAAFVLGIGAKYYRDKHPQPIPYVDPKHPWRKDATPPPSSTPKALRKALKKSNAIPKGRKTRRATAEPSGTIRETHD